MDSQLLETKNMQNIQAQNNTYNVQACTRHTHKTNDI